MATTRQANDGEIGCKLCGLIGCSCAVKGDYTGVAEMFSAALCKRCKSDPCVCHGTRTLGADICIVCRRNMARCICESHATFKPMGDEGARSFDTKPKRPYDEGYVKSLKNEAMHFYYNRDAEGLTRWLDRHLR